MASLTITTRRAKGGARYVVRYRLGGRAYPMVHGGSFRTLKEARARRNLVAGELAAGRNPALVLQSMREQRTPNTFATLFDDFIASRVDVSKSTTENYRTHRDRLLPHLERHDPTRLTWQDLQAIVATLSHELSARSVRLYLRTLSQVLDFADIDPNPARDRRLRLPRVEEKIVEPPSASDLAAIIATRRSAGDSPSGCSSRPA